MTSKVKTKKMKKKLRQHRFAVTILSVLCLYFAVNIIAVQLKVYNNEQKLNEINAKIEIQKDANDEISRIVSGSDDTAAYIEKIAREKLGYARANERVFIDVAGIE